LPSHRNFPHFNEIALWQCHSHFQLSNAQKTNLWDFFSASDCWNRNRKQSGRSRGNQIEQVHLEKPTEIRLCGTETKNWVPRKIPLSSKQGMNQAFFFLLFLLIDPVGLLAEKI